MHRGQEPTDRLAQPRRLNSYGNYFTEELSTRPVLCHTREDREHKVPAASFDILIIIYTIFYPPYML